MNPNGQFGRRMNINSAGQGVMRAAKSAPKLGVGGMVLDTYLNLKGGDDLGTAAFKGAATGLLWSVAGGVMGAQMIGSMAVQGYVGYQGWSRKANENFQSSLYQGTVGGGYQDSTRALTMRQAAVEAIQGSKMNARSALGGEARILNNNMHRTY